MEEKIDVTFDFSSAFKSQNTFVVNISESCALQSIGVGDGQVSLN